MNSLYQRLKELDPKTFERLCFHILKDKYPSLELRHVDGKGGDEGLDVFEGNLYGHPTIWQCKSFPDGVREPQKKQIRESLKAALANFSPAQWILCLSVDLDAKASRWFAKWKESHAARVKIGLFSAGDIVHELLHRRTIRNQFFPGAEIDITELKSVLAKTGELTLEELESVTEGNLELYIERMKEQDARFNFQIIFDGDLGPPPLNQVPPPGVVMSISIGAKTINIIARDFEAIRANPPSLDLGLTDSGIEKYNELLRSGRTQEFAGNELESIKSDWPFFAPLLAAYNPKPRMIIGPSPELLNRSRSVRVTFCNQHGETIEYGLMTMRPTRIGSQEAEFVCSSKTLPFEIDIVFPPQMLSRPDIQTKNISPLNITFRDLRAVGCRIKQVKKFLDAKRMLSPLGEVEIFDLTEEKTLLRMTIQMPERELDSPASMFIDDLAMVAERFGLDLKITADISENDFRSLGLLKTYIESGTLPANNIKMTVEKSEANSELLPEQLSKGPGRFRITHPKHFPIPILLGQSVDTGPCAEEFDAQIVDLDATLERFKSAAIGQGVELNLVPIGPVRLVLLSDG